jgi:beta-1,4-N-acetylglucosaminyltransferase
LILLTLGTYPLSFNRLLSAVDSGLEKGLIKKEIFAQIGHSTYLPKCMKYKKLLPKNEFDELLRASTAIISHAGMGSISLALEANKPLLAFPRLKKFGEHVNDHQLHTAIKFEKLQHILAAYNEEELYRKIPFLHNFTPKKRYSNPKAVANKIADFLNSV